MQIAQILNITINRDKKSLSLSKLKYLRNKKVIYKTQIKKNYVFTNNQSKKSRKDEFINVIMPKQCKYKVIQKDYDEVKTKHHQQFIHQQLIQGNQKLNIQSDEINLVGKLAPLQYYEEYKKLSKTKQISSRNTYRAILQETQNLSILPCCLGIVKSAGDISVLNLNNFKLGDKYIVATAAGLAHTKFIEKCLLSGNRITNKGVVQICNNLRKQVLHLDLSYNKIQSIGSKMISIINDQQYQLQNINYQENKLNQQTINQFCFGIIHSKHLKILNLRSNNICYNCCDSISLLIKHTQFLEQLYLGNNYLSYKGGFKIFHELSKNITIKILDISMNQLGITNKQNLYCSKEIANCLQHNITLLHLDLSNNKFNSIHTEIISQALHRNHTLYGIHYQQNYGYVDSMGFIILMNEQQQQFLSPLNAKKMNSFEITFKRSINCHHQRLKHVCWICQGWSEQNFQFILPINEQLQNNSRNKKLVYIHFDFDLYYPRLINIKDNIVNYITMVPRKYRYFYTFNRKSCFNKNHKQIKFEIPQYYTYQMYNENFTFKVQKAYEGRNKAKKIMNNWNELLIKVQPRTKGLKSKKQKIIWNYAKSSWAKQWKLQTQQLLKKCFEKDWNHSKISNFIKNKDQQEKVKEILRQNYQTILQIYLHFASWSPFGDIWAVSVNAFVQFCTQAKIISKQTPLKIIDLTFITTNSMSAVDWKSNPLVPERGLIRFQFLESIVRLSQEKYKKNGIVQNYIDGLKIMINQHILPLKSHFNSNKWRLQNYFTQQNDILIKNYRQIFNNIYKRNSKLKVKPGEKPFMCFGQFKSIIERVGILNSYIIDRDVFLAFNNSMMRQIDEVENERFIKMTEIQFIEAVARCAYLLPKQCKILVKEQVAIRDGFHLQFEWLIHRVKQTLCSEDLISQYDNQTLFKISEVDDQ